MKGQMKNGLQRDGWVVGNASEFLQLSVEEASVIEMNLTLAAGMREVRVRKGMTEMEVAAKLGTSQSRVAKMEVGDRSVSLDLLVKSLLRIGASQ